MKACRTVSGLGLAASPRSPISRALCQTVLPRENLVEGRLTDLYRDIQYRLNRREILFEVSCTRPRTPLAEELHHPFRCHRHHLTAEHVANRSGTYEALNPGGGRLFERPRFHAPIRLLGMAPNAGTGSRTDRFAERLGVS